MFTLLSRLSKHRLLPRTTYGSRFKHDTNPVSHGAENYFVDNDDTPPPSDPVYKVDPTSDAVESAYEPPTGPWSRAGAGTEEYRTVSKDEPSGPDGHLRYGGNTEEKGFEGTESTESQGRKPEGR